MQTFTPSINPLSFKKVGPSVYRMTRPYDAPLPHPEVSPVAHPNNQSRKVATTRNYLDTGDTIREVLYGLTIIALLAILAFGLGWATQVQKGLVESNAHAMQRVPSVSVTVSPSDKTSPSYYRIVR